MAEFGGEGLKARAQTRIISEPLFLPQFKVLPKLATNFAQQPCYIKGAPAQNSYFKELIAVCVEGSHYSACNDAVQRFSLLQSLQSSFSWAAGKFDKGLILRFKIVWNFQFPSTIFSCHLKKIQMSSHGNSITPFSPNVIWLCNWSLLSK